MTSRHSTSHADNAKAPPPSASRPPAVPKLHVQGSLSRESITIHFSALGQEEEEEEEKLYGMAVSSPNVKEDPGVVTALEASEELILDGVGLDSDAEAAVLPVSTTTDSKTCIALPLGQKSLATPGAFTSNTPCSALSASATSKSVDKPFFSLVKSLSSGVMEPSEIVSVTPAAPASVRHRQLMKTLVKSLSSDAPQDSASSYRLSDSRLNLHLFKQFTQSRAPVVAAASSDSKTAPSSPLTSPESRNFKASVEASIEDTKRRFSEAIYEPLQLFNKIMGDESGGVGSSPFRSKALSSSASELTNLASFNSVQPESNNNNYTIKEEEADCTWESEETANRDTSVGSPNYSADTSRTKSPKMNSSTSASLGLDKCSMSALAKLEEDDFCILSSEDFETTEEDCGEHTDNAGSRVRPSPSGSAELCSEDESEGGIPSPSVPHYTLIFLTILVYGVFVLPLPTYVNGIFTGLALGFMLAIAVVWLAGPKPSGYAARHPRRHGELWNMAKLYIKEPGIFKGWMNEIMNYDPETYHATLTQSVFVRLEGSVLRLSKPNHNIARRATHNEPKPDVTYISQKIYDLTNGKISFAPQSLARKRVWNKKYPICIELAKQDNFMSKAEGDATDTVDQRAGATGDAGSDETKRSSCPELTLYLFGRTGREKEEWHRRLLLASKPARTETKAPVGQPGSKSALSSHSRSSSRGSLDDVLTSQAWSRDSTAGLIGKPKPLLDYSVYMAALVPPENAFSTPTPVAPANPVLQSPQSSPGVGKKLPSSSSSIGFLVARGEEEPLAWVNSMIGRVAWDFLGEPYWADVVSKKIQMKLSKIRLPYFMNELTLTELDMGVSIPRILNASKPSVDHQGLWFDLEMSYSGSFLMTLETKMNLIRLGKEEDCLRTGDIGREGYRPRTYCLADSDEESSSAGSSDEDDTSELTNDIPGAEGYTAGRQPSKIMRFVNKIAKSKYFQKATETEFIKKKMEEVSNTPLLLTVEVQELRGTLAVNIPPPPTDRIWYGFRSPPHLELKARPKLGEREVTLAHVTDWIEKKLDQEFQKVFVMPNMDDVWLTVMHSAMDPRSSGGPAASTSDTTQRGPEPSRTEGAVPSDI
ncbi:hypothetical protein DPEC_G00176190 [Dallia pectoralis]|uniref:Uncharacterized protein n=1 Tax=Dallia pectoralis TaxID=75939 RepID=A0ACC2GF11_DALPE|nr:hypothetical protein DPEC_G00176190 [Dallia pectoralis]